MENDKKTTTSAKKDVNPYKLTIPYHRRVKKEEDIMLENFLESIRVFKVNMTLLSLISANSKYVKILKDLVFHMHTIEIQEHDLRIL